MAAQVHPWGNDCRQGRWHGGHPHFPEDIIDLGILHDVVY